MTIFDIFLMASIFGAIGNYYGYKQGLRDMSSSFRKKLNWLQNEKQKILSNEASKIIRDEYLERLSQVRQESLKSADAEIKG